MLREKLIKEMHLGINLSEYKYNDNKQRGSIQMF